MPVPLFRSQGHSSEASASQALDLVGVVPALLPVLAPLAVDLRWGLSPSWGGFQEDRY